MRMRPLVVLLALTLLLPAADSPGVRTFLRERLMISPDLSENAFFEAHKDAALAADRADEDWDLEWALPDELRDPGAWRAAVADLPPASLRGTRSSPEQGIVFVGWPPIAN